MSTTGGDQICRRPVAWFAAGSQGKDSGPRGDICILAMVFRLALGDRLLNVQVNRSDSRGRGHRDLFDTDLAMRIMAEAILHTSSRRDNVHQGRVAEA